MAACPAGYGLHEHAGSVGRDTERVGERVLAHRGDHGGADRHAEIFEPAAHRAAIDACTESREAVFLAMERQSVAELVARDVREQRRCRERARDQLPRKLGGGDRRGIAVADLVLDARDHEADVARASPHQLVAVFGTDALRGTLEREVGELDALLGQVQLGEPTTTLGPRLALAARGGVVVGIRGAWQSAGERIELTQLRRELQLELLRIDALSLCDHEAPARELDLKLQVVVARAQSITLRDRIVGPRALDGRRGALRCERRLELGDARLERLARRSARVLDHRSALPICDRAVEIR